MVECMLNLVLCKLADDAFRKLSRMWGVDEQVEKLKREISRIRSFLKDADKKRIRDEMQKHWVKEVRDIAYDIEDAIDKALLLEEEVLQKSTGMGGVIMRVLKKPRKVPALDELADQINRILERIEEISSSRIRYTINDLVEGSRGDHYTLPLKPTMLPDIDDPNVVGFDTHTDKVVKMLLDENTQRRRVVSIVGVGGLGKTTLARKAYNSADVKSSFSRRLWVTVSQKFELIDILIKILKQIRHIDSNEQGNETEYFLAELHKFFREHKYLLVLDDVWTEELWCHVEHVLVDANNGSRVLITSRNENVARVADPSHEPWKLPYLLEDHGLRLLFNKVICNQPYPSDLIDVATQLVKKCGGVPLALIVLGSLLSRKPPEYTEWNELLQTMSWHTDGVQCIKILTTSYDDLPLGLKYCFIYFAAFPEDYKINVEELARMWIAEGFIPEEENKTLEQTAERFLQDLVQRSMVEVSCGSYDMLEVSYGSYDIGHDSIYFCHVHDLLRDLAIEKAKEDNFLAVCSTPDKMQSYCGARRLAVHHFDIDGLVKNKSFNLRTLLCFDSHMPNCSGHRILKVLSLTDGRTQQSLTHESFEGLTQLRYLQFRLWWDANIDSPIRFIKLISSMKFLQTLDLRCIKSCDLCDFTWDIETLRHVMLPRCSLGPPSGTNLRNMQTLTGIRNRESWGAEALPYLPNLCTLEIKITNGFSWKVVAAFLYTLKSLVNLDLRGKFSSGAGVTLDTAIFPTNLTKLILWDFRIQRVVPTVLEKLHDLKLLYLVNGIDEEQKQMRCSAGGFPHLKALFVFDSNNIEEWEIEEGAMPMLQQLHVRNCPMLQVPLGLKHLARLRNLSWSLYGDQSATAKAEELRSLCEHVPHLDIRLF